VYEILLTAGIFNFLSKNLALDILQALYIKSGWQAQRAETFVKKGKAFRTSRCSAPTQVFMNNKLFITRSNRSYKFTAQANLSFQLLNLTCALM
jgi:hypothetical protein